MKSIAIVFLSLSLFLLKNEVAAQVKSVSRFSNVIESGKTKRVYEEAKGNKNEAEFLFSGLFLFYKTFISSQDQAVCTFTPSCSEYGIMSVKKYGIVKGGLMTADRLTRCNGLSPTNYEIDKKSGLLKDDPTKNTEYQAMIIK